MGARSNQSIGKVSARYAQSLFALAEEKKLLKAIDADLKTLKTLWLESSEFKTLCVSPQIGTIEKFSAFEAIAKKAGLNILTVNFLKTLSSHKRLMALPVIIARFQEYELEASNTLKAIVTSAEALDDKNLKDLKMIIEKKTGQHVEIESTIDQNILGGFIIRFKGQMLDLSLRRKLLRVGQLMKGSTVS